MLILEKILMSLLMVTITVFFSVSFIWGAILVLKQIKKLFCEE